MDGATYSLQHSLPSRASCYTVGLSLGKQDQPTDKGMAHVGYSGNEAADVLAKKATQEGIPTFIPAPRNHIKSLLQKESIIRWQKEWDNGETGRSVHNVFPKVKTTPTPWQRPEIIIKGGAFLDHSTLRDPLSSCGYSSSNTGKMMYSQSIFAFAFMFICWRAVNTQEPADEVQRGSNEEKKMYSQSIFAFAFMFICWRAVNTQEPADEVQRGSNENHLAANRMMRYTPDMRLVLNGLLRYENAISKKAEEALPYPFFHLSNRSSKGSIPSVDDPLAVLATGFMGSRGKRDDYDEIPVFANGFPAGRG
ncbi:hypothetical protein AVEN_21246-2 [Araneus ventricosus]|uniref:RNase H type-1 domain-containing protein n=1 Tax=Araneus ventricosus TaxID=182803 RepID=A0A4Y2GJ61_ARAVE|nr:hypothetical protein AVEN_21246-2 [Araneus ventricosus]